MITALPMRAALMKVFATYNIKAAWARRRPPSTSPNLAARDGPPHPAVDLDPQGAATYPVPDSPRVKGGGKALVQGRRPLEDAIKGTTTTASDLLPADFTYRNMDLALDAAKKPTRRTRTAPGALAADYDVVFLDCPRACRWSPRRPRGTDTLLVPLIPTTLSLRTFDQLTEFVRHRRRTSSNTARLLLHGRRAQRLHREIVERLPAQRQDIATNRYPGPVRRRADGRAPSTAGHLRPRRPACERYEQLWAQAQQLTP